MKRSKVLFLVAILALVLSFVLFGNGVNGDFVFDDTIVVVGNPFIGNRLEGFGEIFTTPYFAYQPRPGLYRPLTIASYSINAFLFGQSPASFHVVNILLHALTSFLIFILLYQISNKAVPIGEADRGSSIRRLRIGTFAGFLFFMFLPIHVEAVTSIVGRAEILSLLFVVVALIFSLQKRYILASGSFFLGLLSKEMAISFLPIFLFLEFFWSRFCFQQSWNDKIEDPRFANRAMREANRDTKSVFKTTLYFIPVLVLYALLRYVALGEYFLKNDATLVHNPIAFTRFFSGLWTSFQVLYLYLEKMLLPTSLSIDYSFNQIPIVENIFVSPKAIIGVVILTLLVILFFKTSDFLLRFGVIIFLASYFVISNWVFRTGTIMAERLMYTPSLGLALMAGSVISRIAPGIKNKKVFYGFLALILVFYGFIIIDRNKDWLNEQNLYESAYAAAPESVVNQTNKAYLEFISGNYGGAESRLDEVLNVVPNHVPAIYLAGQNYKKLGQIKKSEEYWHKAINLNDNYLRAYLSLGVLYYENGYFKSAEKVLTDAVNIYPRWSEVLFLALSKISLDKLEEAADLIIKHFGNNPSRKELKFALGLAYFTKGEKDAAYRYFNQVKDPEVNMDDFIKTFEGSKVVILGEF